MKRKEKGLLLNMDKLNLTKITQANKKVLIRKEIEEDRLGEEYYSEDLLSPYAVYLVRKFEEGTDYVEQSQFEDLLTAIVENFEQIFQQFVIKNIYVRMTQKTVHITLLIALAQPLTKLEMNELRTWMGGLEVPEPPEKLEHMSIASQEIPLEMVKGLQETTSEILLLTEMMNQFSLNLSDVYKELQIVKNKKTPPIMKVVKSDAAVRKSLESENAELLKHSMEKLDNLSTAFLTFKNQVDQRLTELSKPKTPPKFKVFFGGEKSEVPSLESRLEEALKEISILAKEVKYSERKITELSATLEKKQSKKTPKFKLSAKKEIQKKENELEKKLATTTEEVMLLTKQLQEVSQKLTTVETNILEVKPDPETVARIEKDHGQLQKTTSETMKLNQVIDGLYKKLQNVETELTTVKTTKTTPVIKLKKSETLNNLAKQHQMDQDQLMANATEIKKLTQTVGKVDVELIKAHQKITELENKVQTSKREAVDVTPAPPIHQPMESRQTKEAVAPTLASTKSTVGPVAPPAARQLPNTETRQEKARENKLNEPNSLPQRNVAKSSGILNSDSSFPSKEEFLRASRPLSAQVRMQAEIQAQVQNQERMKTSRKPVDPVVEEHASVTLAIEEVLDRVSDQPLNDNNQEQKLNESSPAEVIQTKAELPPLRRLKKLEWEIHSFFEKTRGMGHKGMVSKDDFQKNMKEIEGLPSLWTKVYELNKQDLILGTDLSCQKLIADLDVFIPEATGLFKKRRVMGKWIYCPKEVEQKLEGYKRLGEYFELYISRREGIDA